MIEKKNFFNFNTNPKYFSNEVDVFDYILKENKKRIDTLFLWEELTEYELPFRILENNVETLLDIDSLLEQSNNLLYISLAAEKNKNTNREFKNIKFIHSPLSHLYFTYFHLYKPKLELLQREYPDSNFQKLFITLNRNPREHRCLLMDKLSENNLLRYGIYSWLRENHSYKWRHWKQKVNVLSNKDIHTLDNVIDEYRGYPLVNIVSETTTDLFYISEKTIKPLLMKQIFLLNGCQYQNHKMKYYGFELFEEIFDYEFDSYPDIESRVDGIVKNLYNLKDESMEHIWNLVKDKVEHNYNRCIEIIQNRLFIDPIYHELHKKYPNENMHLFRHNI